MAQRERSDFRRDRRLITQPPLSDSNRRNWRPKPGDGVCQYCEKFDVKGLTRARASGYLLCHSCISSSRVRNECAERAKAPSARQGGAVSELRQITKDEALTIFNSGLWKDWTHRQRAEFQLRQDRLAMPFDVFHEAVEKTIGRSVSTHEFGLNRDGLIAEMEGHEGAPSIAEIMALLPAKKVIVVESSPAAREGGAVSDDYECPSCGGHHEPRSCDGGRARDEEHARRKEVVRLAEAFAAALLAKDREVIVPSWATCHAFRVAELFEFDARRYMETGERPGSTKAPAARKEERDA